MMQGKMVIIALIAFIIGIGTGFVLRPMILPSSETAVVSSPAAVLPSSTVRRGKPYFAAHLAEAQQIMQQCAQGSARGDECSNAEQAIVEAEGRDRFKKFMGN